MVSGPINYEIKYFFVPRADSGEKYNVVIQHCIINAMTITLRVSTTISRLNRTLARSHIFRTRGARRITNLYRSKAVRFRRNKQLMALYSSSRLSLTTYRLTARTYWLKRLRCERGGCLSVCRYKLYFILKRVGHQSLLYKSCGRHCFLKNCFGRSYFIHLYVVIAINVAADLTDWLAAPIRYVRISQSRM